MAPASDRILKRLADAEDLIGPEGIDGTSENLFLIHISRPKAWENAQVWVLPWSMV